MVQTRDMTSTLTPADALTRQGTSTDATVARILACWEQANDTVREQGAQWYPSALEWCYVKSAQYGRTVEQVAAVVAHLSPRCRWEKNLLQADGCLSGHIVPGTMRRELSNAQRAMVSDDVLATFPAPKTGSFVRNILGDHDAVTVDVWAVRVALGARDDLDLVLNRKGVYQAIADAYRIAARRVGVTPATMQATTWIVIRGSAS